MRVRRAQFRKLHLPRVRGPAPTIRLRLTVLYGLVFLITGAGLLTIGYVLVRHNIGGVRFRERAGERGLPSVLLPPPPFLGTLARDFAVAREVRRQLVGGALHRLLVEYLFALGVMTMISVGAGWLLAGRALRPLRDITATAPPYGDLTADSIRSDHVEPLSCNQRRRMVGRGIPAPRPVGRRLSRCRSTATKCASSLAGASDSPPRGTGGGRDHDSRPSRSPVLGCYAAPPAVSTRRTRAPRARLRRPTSAQAAYAAPASPMIALLGGSEGTA